MAGRCPEADGNPQRYHQFRVLIGWRVSRDTPSPVIRRIWLAGEMELHHNVVRSWYYWICCFNSLGQIWAIQCRNFGRFGGHYGSDFLSLVFRFWQYIKVTPALNIVRFMSIYYLSHKIRQLNCLDYPPSLPNFSPVIQCIQVHL